MPVLTSSAAGPMSGRARAWLVLLAAAGLLAPQFFERALALELAR